MFWIKKCSSLLGNDCHLLKVKRRDSIIETSLNDRAHTVFMKTSITLRRKTQKTYPELTKYKSEDCQWRNSGTSIVNPEKPHSPVLSLMILKNPKTKQKKLTTLYAKQWSLLIINHNHSHNYTNWLTGFHISAALTKNSC